MSQSLFIIIHSLNDRLLKISEFKDKNLLIWLILIF